MICSVIQKIGLFIFWKCIDENKREESIREHRYSRMKNNHIKNIISKTEEFEDKYLLLKREIKRINNIENKDEKIKELEILTREINNV